MIEKNKPTKLEKLRQKHVKLQLAIAAEESKAKAKERKNDTRRKFLIGNLVFRDMKTDSQLEKKSISCYLKNSPVIMIVNYLV